MSKLRNYSDGAAAFAQNRPHPPRNNRPPIVPAYNFRYPAGAGYQAPTYQVPTYQRYNYILPRFPAQRSIYRNGIGGGILAAVPVEIPNVPLVVRVASPQMEAEFGANRVEGCPACPPNAEMYVQMASPNSSNDEFLMEEATGLSATNIYIRGLEPDVTDKDLSDMCIMYGKILSTKAILDKINNKCRGYGFVDFELSSSAERALRGLNERGILAQMAKVGIHTYMRRAGNTEPQDLTNVYFANLPMDFKEEDFDKLLIGMGQVISVRILRDENNRSRGVGFARMSTPDECQAIIQTFNGRCIQGSRSALHLKFADGAEKRRFRGNLRAQREFERFEAGHRYNAASPQHYAPEGGYQQWYPMNVQYGIPAHQVPIPQEMDPNAFTCAMSQLQNHLTMMHMAPTDPQYGSFAAGGAFVNGNNNGYGQYHNGFAGEQYGSDLPLDDSVHGPNRLWYPFYYHKSPQQQ